MSIHPKNPTAAFVDEPRPLRVAVNAVPLLSPLTGIGHYVKALMEAHAASGKLIPTTFMQRVGIVQYAQLPAHCLSVG